MAGDNRHVAVTREVDWIEHRDERRGAPAVSLGDRGQRHA